MNSDDKTVILSCLVGSHAHGLATYSSDYDYRGTYVLPTTKILSLNYKVQNTNWLEGDEDNTSWELGHFLQMACSCNPTVLEVFVAPVKSANEDGEAVRALFPYVWNPTRVRDAFVGYGLNQRTKFLKNQDRRAPKYAVAYLRTLVLAEHLLLTRELLCSAKDLPMYDTLVAWKAKHPDTIDYGEVIGVCKTWEDKVNAAYDKHMNNTPQVPNLDRINEFLLRMRKKHWD